MPIRRLPSPGENLLLIPHCHPFDAPGGKGCNQAIAASFLSLCGVTGDGDGSDSNGGDIDIDIDIDIVGTIL